MAKQATRPRRGDEDAPRPRRRLTAEARKSSILEAARRAFIETGDVNGTTVRVIADRAGISEGVIYRHFESKDQLFIEAVVEPLTEAVDKLVASQVVDREEPLTPERQLETMNGLYHRLISTLEEILPLLGLVLFGDPKVAQRFYRDNFAGAMDRLAAAAWQEVEARYGFETESPDISARAVMGTALVLALEGRHNKGFDRHRAIALASEGTVHGFFPNIKPSRTLVEARTPEIGQGGSWRPQ